MSSFKNSEVKIFLFVVMFFCFFISSKDSFAYGNYQTLEITNIKPAGTGSPTISQYNRIFRAYPGITYTVPVGVIGGAFPYVFSLTNAPSGMTIDNHTGVVTWLNPQTSASNIEVTVHDKDGDSVAATWNITVTDSTNDFIFVNDDYSETESGSIAQPYNSIQDVLDLGSSAVNRIVYFREGTYAVPRHNGYRDSPGLYGCNLLADGGRAHIWIGYPGETATLSMGGVTETNAWWFETHTGIASQSETWFENLIIDKPIEWGIRHGAQGNYFTFWNNTMQGLTFIETSGNSNWGGIYTPTGGLHGNFMYVADNLWKDNEDAQFFGSIYRQNKLLLERNVFRDRTYTGKINGYTAYIAIKADNDNVTVRRNEFYVPSNQTAFGTSINSRFGEYDGGGTANLLSENTEIYHNLVYGGSTMQFTYGDEMNPDTLWFYRNTIVSTRIRWTYLNYPTNCKQGPYIFENNVFQNQDEWYYCDYCGTSPASCIMDNGNYSAETGLVNSSGLLINRSNVGTYGWEIADDEYWSGSSSDTTPPTGSVSINTSAALTNNTNVTLGLSATDASGVTQMKVSNTNSIDSVSAETFATVKSWVLTATNGLKTVYVWFKDAIGNWMSTPATDTITLDTVAPTLTQTTAVVTPSTDTTPNYIFDSTEAGTITYAGDCSAAVTNAVLGSNSIVFNALAVGTHSNCTIRVVDTAGNTSNILSVPSFTITSSTVTCTSFAYSDWSACQSNNTRTRTIAASLPSGCTGGSPEAITETCTYTSGGNTGGGGGGGSATCTGFTYSGWGACQSSGTQTRIVASQTPSGCTGGSPILTQNCTYTSTATTTTTTATTTTNLPSITDLNNQSSAVVNSVTQAEARLVDTYNQKVTLTKTTTDLYIKIVNIGSNSTSLNTGEKYSVAYFIHYGTPSTRKLGAGERTGVISSYQSAYAKPPKAENEWQDVIKIGNGRWPTERNAAAETRARQSFQAIYLRTPNTSNAYDNTAIMIMAYGLRPLQRNMANEKTAIKSFIYIYHTNPTTAQHWDIVRAIAYSGASR